MAIVALFLGGAAAGLVFYYILKTLPSPDLLQNRQVSESTQIYDRTGQVLLFEIYGDEKRTIVPLSSIPDAVKKATIALEDANFYNHSAFDWKSIVRALITDILQRQLSQGGSTITQQLAKTAFLGPEKTFTRKLKELILAFQLEKRFSKDEILELYLNQIPYGSNAYGIEAASQLFFDKSARDLTLAEAAVLASLPKAPSYYSPWGSNAKALMDRSRYALDKMLEAGSITAKEKELALAEKIKFAQPSQGIKAPHFVMMTQDYLNRQYGDDFVRTQGLKVITTLDWPTQQLAEKVIADGAQRNEELYQGQNAALVAQDAVTGQILALVGSRDYFDTANDGNFNVAAQGLRQPGSAIKPFVYAAAFKKGYTPEMVLFDLETEFDSTGNPDNSYQPANYDGRFRGPIDLRHALAQSINVPAVKTLYLVGLSNALATVNNFGLTTLTERSRYGLSLVLGGGEVKLIDLVNAYAVFAQDGIKHKQSFILKVTSKGKVLEDYQDAPEQIIEPQYARLINDILSDAEARAPIFGTGLNMPAFPDYQIAIKTGTSNDYRDAWSIGYTPSLVVGVWAGNNDNAPMTKEGASFRAAVPLWQAFMNEELKSRRADVFNKPDAAIVADKPVLNGSYIANYQSGGKTYPQVHSILFYADKNNPLGPAPKNPETDAQFKNWEQPILEWAQKNIPNFSEFNQPLPPDSQLISQNVDAAPLVNLKIDIIKPANGDFIGNTLDLDAQITSGAFIKEIDVYFNNVLIDTKTANLSNVFHYQKTLSPLNIQLQNLLKFIVTNDTNGRFEKDLILFKQP